MRVCLRALLHYKALDAVLHVALLGNRDGSDQSAHLHNLTRIVTSFIAYHLRWMYIPTTHTGLQKIKKTATS